MPLMLGSPYAAVRPLAHIVHSIAADRYGRARSANMAGPREAAQVLNDPEKS